MEIMLTQIINDIYFFLKKGTWDLKKDQVSMFDLFSFSLLLTIMFVIFGHGISDFFGFEYPDGGIMESHSYVHLILLGGVLAPMFEELLFRNVLVFNKKKFFFICGLICLCISCNIF